MRNDGIRKNKENSDHKEDICNFQMHIQFNFRMSYFKSVIFKLLEKLPAVNRYI